MSYWQCFDHYQFEYYATYEECIRNERKCKFHVFKHSHLYDDTDRWRFGYTKDIDWKQKMQECRGAVDGPDY